MSENNLDTLDNNNPINLDNIDNIGILDPSGENPNPLTGEPYSDKYKQLSKQWAKLPAYSKRTEIINTIKDNKVILITSGTGSGKTVLIPKFCLHAFNYDARIAITLPKRMITQSSAEYAAATLDVKIGSHVGYQFRGSDKKAKGVNNKLIYATDGTIKARLMNDPLLKDFDAVIIDEAHERKVNIDLLLYMLKNVIENRDDFKLIIMSATINSQIFKAYYKDSNYTHIDVGGGTNYPIKSIFLEQNLKDNQYVEKGVEVIKKILKETDDGDILFFVTGANEARDVCSQLGDGDHFCVEVYSGMDKEKKELSVDKDLYKEKTGKTRKVAVSTNVAESSMTIDGIKYVIDAGMENFSYYDPKQRANALDKQFITQAQAKQRMGRTGRTGPGICYHLYTQEVFDEVMKKFPEPEIRKSNLYDNFLNLLRIESIGNVTKLKEVISKFIEPPPKDYVDSGLGLLKELRLIKDGRTTQLGEKIDNMRMDPMEGLAVYAAYHLNCMKEVIMILAMISASRGSVAKFFKLPQDIVGRDNRKRLKAMTEKFEFHKANFNTRYGDHLSLLKMMDRFRERKDKQEKLFKWAHSHFLRLDVFNDSRKDFRRMYGITRRELKEDKIEIPNIMEYDLNYRIMAAFMFGFRTQIVKVKDVIGTMIGGKTSFIDDVKDNNIVLYHELFSQNGNKSLNVVTKISKKSVELLNILVELIK